MLRSPIDWPLSRGFALLLAAAYAILALLLMSNFDAQLIKPESLDQVFTDSAQRLLRGDFTVSPAAIQYEAFLHDQRTYTYFGIFPVLIRLPFVALGLAMQHVSRISCLTALTIAVYHFLRLFQAAQRAAPPATRLHWSWFVILASAVLTGAPITLLASASLYHEVIFWAAAFTATFNYVVLRRWFQSTPATSTDLLILATVAGLCLIDRVAEGTGLYASLLFILVGRFTRQIWPWPQAGTASGQARLAAFREIMAAGCLSLMFVAIFGLVNFERWGNPLITSPFNEYIQYQGHPDWMRIYERHGLFSPVRVAVAALYYSTAVKIETALPSIVPNYYGYLEGPRSLVLACAPLTFLLFSAGLWSALRRPRQFGRPFLLLLGESVGVIIVLGFPAMAIRYTFSFWGPLMALAPAGAQKLQAWRPGSRFVPAVLVILLLLGVAGSGLTLLRYKLVSVATDSAVRYRLSNTLHPIICPHAAVKPDAPPAHLATVACPPLW